MDTDKLLLSRMIAGYELHARARRLSPHTIADYGNTHRKFLAYLGDIPFNSITSLQIEEFLASRKVSKKTLLNYHTGLSALWTWAVNESLTTRHLLRYTEPPRPERRAIIPYSEQDVRAMLAVLSHSKPYRNHGTTASHALPNVERNRAIILLLLDTGMRAEELVTLTFADLDLDNQHVKIFGKGDKERLVPISSRTTQALWKYQITRTDLRPTAPAFTSANEQPMDRHDLRKRLAEIGKRANLRGVNVHRFRHTFAINYLRNGGDIYTLQLILGHATLEMCKRYLHLAQTDADARHKIASPVMNWRL